jgi:hypothetical protein
MLAPTSNTADTNRSTSPPTSWIVLLGAAEDGDRAQEGQHAQKHEQERHDHRAALRVMRFTVITRGMLGQGRTGRQLG